MSETGEKDMKVGSEESNVIYALSNQGSGAEQVDESNEVFKRDVNGVQYRTMGWKKTCIVLLKLQFATGVLSVPFGLNTVGAAGGAIILVVSGILSTYFAMVNGNFRNKHAGVHSLPDAAYIVGGRIYRDVTAFIFMLNWILAGGSGLVALSVALNTLSNHGACTVVFNVVAAILTASFASIRKISDIGVLTWFGFGSIFTAIFIVVVAVTQVARPAAAPQTGDFDLGFVAVAYPTFIAGLSGALSLFSSFGATSTFLPVLAEMRDPKAFKKPLVVSMTFLVCCYLAFGLVVYAYCGKYVASPALGSAGPLIGKISYGIAIPGLIITSTLWLHVAAKFLFVKLLRNTNHLQANTKTHWFTWLACTFGLTFLSFIVAEAVPFFNYLLSFIGSLCSAPTVIGIPCSFWLYENRNDWKGPLTRKLLFALHVLILLISLFLMVAGTYTAVMSIITAYQTGAVGSPFSCDNNA